MFILWSSSCLFYSSSNTLTMSYSITRGPLNAYFWIPSPGLGPRTSDCCRRHRIALQKTLLESIFLFDFRIHNKFILFKNNDSSSTSASFYTPQKVTLVHWEADIKIGWDAQVCYLEGERRKENWVGGISNYSTVPWKTSKANGKFLVKGAPWLAGMGLP